MGETIEGKLTIADEVIAMIAAGALEEIDGIAPVLSSSLSRLGKKNYFKGVRVKQEDQKVFLEARVVVKYGLPIQKVGSEACRKMSAQVERVTGLPVAEVRVRVEGVDFNE